MSSILQTYIHKSGSTINLQKYLEKNNRALGQDFSLDIRHKENWGKEFDDQRKAFGKDRGRRCYHFVISPNPEEHATLDQIRELATTWVGEHFPSSKWTVTYHDDNAKHILHAHVVVNAVQRTGYKIQINPKEYNDLRYDVESLSKQVGFTLPSPKSPRDVYLENLRLKDLGQKPQTKCRPKSACEKRIESRGFKTWKQQLRDIIDINKQCATDWQSFVELMNRDGIEVRETHNKRTGEIGYTYHFKEPVFNKKTGKEFHFACKDKNLSDNADNPLKYTRSEIYYFFDFKTPAKFEDERFLRVEKHKIHVEMMKYFGYMPLIMPPSHKKVVGVLKPKHNLPENLKVVEPKTYHGKLTRATIRQTQANIQAMAEAIRIVKEQNIRSEADLKKRLEETTTKKQELELKRHKFDEICDQYDALANNLKMYEDTGKREYKNWLKKHGVDYKNIDSDYYKRMSKTVKQQRDNIKNEIALLDNFEGECQKAYNIIRDNLEVRTYLPCTSRCEGILPNQKIPYVIKKPSPPTAEQRLIQEQQQISENETMRYARQIQYWQYINSPRKSQLEEVQLADNTQKLQQESSNIDTGIENKPVRNECAHSASTSPVQQVVEKERPRHLPPTENIAVATQRAADYNVGLHQSNQNRTRKVR